MKVVGVACSTKTAFLTLAIDGSVARAPVERIDVAYQYEASTELEATLEEVGRAWAQIKPDLVVLLKAESMVRWSYDEIAPRVALETLIRLAAVKLRPRSRSTCWRVLRFARDSAYL
jgi:hypothetical protein